MSAGLLFILLLAAQEAGSRPAVFVDGEPVRASVVSLNADPGHFLPGDLLHVAGHLLAPPAEKELRFRTTPEEDGRLLLQVEGKPDRVVAATISWRMKDKEPVTHNPLAGMSAEEIRGLWGLRVDSWTDAVAGKVSLIDPARTCLTLNDRALREPGKKIPPLPAGLRALRIDSNTSENVSDYSELRNQKELRYFSLEGICGPFDASVLAEARSLRVLNLRSQEIGSIGALKDLGELRFLDLSWVEKLDDVSFLRGCPELRKLYLHQTGVRDLTPIDGLKRLEIVHADMSAVVTLPKGELPALRTLRLLSTPAKTADVEAFAKSHPACRVLFGWQRVFEDAVAGATRLRIREGGTCHRREEEKTLFESRDPAVIKQAMELIAVEEDSSGFHCMCCGSPTLEFYRNDELVVMMGFHHGRSVRWPGGWPGDALLSADSAKGLVAWLDARGVSGPRKEIEDSKARALEEQRRQNRALEGLPKDVQNAYGRGTEALVAALAAAFPSKEKQLDALLGILGSTNANFMMLGKEPFERFEREELEAAVDRNLFSGNRRLRRGAVQLWLMWDSPLKDWAPKEIGRLHGVVLTVLQEGRFVRSRQRAMEHLETWAPELPAEEVTRRLEAGLLDPHSLVRRSAMLAAGRLRHEKSAETLLKILRGTPPEAKPLPELPAEELEGATDEGDPIGRGHPEAEVAALALGLLGFQESKDTMLKMEPSSMREVALALLGEPERLRPVHFDGRSDGKDLQLSAVEAVLRCKGRVGLEMALDYHQCEYWWEPHVVGERLTAMLVAQKAPGSESLSRASRVESLKEWFATHGQAYLEGFKR